MHFIIKKIRSYISYHRLSLYKKLLLSISLGAMELVSVYAHPATEKGVEKVLTENKTLKELDSQLNGTYQALMHILSYEEKDKLKAEQRLWIKQRNQVLNNKLKVEAMYQQRIDTLIERNKEITSHTDLALFLNSSQKINYNDATLKKALNKCPLLVCKAYQAFMEYDAAPDNPNTLQKARDLFTKIAKNIFFYDQEEFDEIMVNKPQEAFLRVLADKHLYDFMGWEKEVVPLWLVLKHPQILNYMGVRFSPRVLSDHSINSLPEFKELNEIISEMWSSHFEPPEYRGGPGTIRLDVVASNYNLDCCLSFAPSLLEGNNGKSFLDHRIYLKAWSQCGIWNRLAYKRLEQLLPKAIKALEAYYQRNYDLHRHASAAEKLLVHYISEYFVRPNRMLSPAFEALNQADGSIAELQKFTHQFKQEDWDELLHRAILADCDLQTIKWIIDSGANINHAFDYETPLMNAVTRPDIMSLLLEKGADIKAKTPMGKTALFYAIQFGSRQSIEMLLNKGAAINEAIKSLEKFKEIVDVGFYAPEIVADFTPLAYALRYGTAEIIQLLRDKKATLGKVGPRLLQENTLRNWVYKNKYLSETELKQLITQIISVN